MPAGFGFRPGQYLQVEHPDGAIPLSIASAPRRLPAVFLHYLSEPRAAEAARFDELLAQREPLEISGPYGNVGADLRTDEPLLLAAGGTGIAQVLSFIDAFEADPPVQPVEVLWCVDRTQDLYLDSTLHALRTDRFDVQLFADPARTSGNAGLRWLREAGPRYADTGTIILAGSPGFVHAAVDTLVEAGVPRTRMQSDVFSYAPRA